MYSNKYNSSKLLYVSLQNPTLYNKMNYIIGGSGKSRKKLFTVKADTNMLELQNLEDQLKRAQSDDVRKKIRSDIDKKIQSLNRLKGNDISKEFVKMCHYTGNIDALNTNSINLCTGGLQYLKTQTETIVKTLKEKKIVPTNINDLHQIINKLKDMPVFEFTNFKEKWVDGKLSENSYLPSEKLFSIEEVTSISSEMNSFHEKLKALVDNIHLHQSSVKTLDLPTIEKDINTIVEIYKVIRDKVDDMYIKKLGNYKVQFIENQIKTSKKENHSVLPKPKLRHVEPKQISKKPAWK